MGISLFVEAPGPGGRGSRVTHAYAGRGAAAAGGQVLGSNFGGGRDHWAEWRFALGQPGLRDAALYIRYCRMMAGDVVFDVALDGRPAGNVVFRGGTGGWGERPEHFRIAQVKLGGLGPGEHSIRLAARAGASNVNIDGMFVAASGFPLPDEPEAQVRLAEAFFISSQAMAAAIVARRQELGGSFDSAMQLITVPGMTPELFDAIYPRLTTHTEPLTVGLINVNTAPAEVLAALPGITLQLAEQMVQARRGGAGGVSWLLDVLSPEQAVKIGPYVTCRSARFRVVSVGVFAGEVVRVEAIIQRRIGEQPAKVVYYRVMEFGPHLPEQLLQSGRSSGGLSEEIGS